MVHELLTVYFTPSLEVLQKSGGKSEEEEEEEEVMPTVHVTVIPWSVNVILKKAWT